MSKRYKGAILSSTPPTTSTSSASGVWTEQQFMQGVASGSWPALAGAPTIGTATAGALNASVAFTAPTYTGSGITGYTATSSPGGITGTGASSPITVSGLTAGTAYTFTVTATTAAGQSSASAASNSVTPTAPQYIEDVFSTYLYAGNDSTQTITNGIDLSGKGGLVWIKNRTNAITHLLTNTITINSVLRSNTTAAQFVASTLNFSYSSTGFALNNSFTDTNSSGSNFVSWTFRKQPKFFDVVTYTGNGGTNNITHNLGSIPGCIIIKSTSTTGDWAVICRSSYGSMYYYYFSQNTNGLNSTGAATGPYDSTAAINATTFDAGQLQDTGGSTNQNGVSYVAYVFAHNAGGFGLTGTDNVISCGSYTGNGSVNGPSINLGYEPQFVIIKQSSGSNNWELYDNMRGVATGGNDALLRPNTSGSEENTDNILSFTSTGFQLTNIYSNTNGSGETYIYIAIRRGPMKVPTVGTSVYSSETHSGVVTNTKYTYTTNFPVDLLWQGARTPGGSSKFLTTDRLRVRSGTTTSNSLVTASTDAETAINGYASLFFDNNTGFSVNDTNGSWNGSAYYSPASSWAFRRAPSFFDEVCYTGTGSAQTVTHNLGVAPELIFNKSRSTDDLNGWVTYSAPSGNDKVLRLNSTQAAGTTSGWNNQTPTSTQFFINGYNNSSVTYVAYLFATCAGVSKVGSYTGNGTTQTINCGFTGGARFVLIKRTDTTGDWYVYDTVRGMTTLTDPYLLLNDFAAEVATLGSVTTVSTGFALNSTILAAINVNGGSYIFLAIA